MLFSQHATEIANQAAPSEVLRLFFRIVGTDVSRHVLLVNFLDGIDAFQDRVNLSLLRISLNAVGNVLDRADSRVNFGDAET